MPAFPTGLRHYFDGDPAVGRVLRIGTRPVKRGPVVEVDSLAVPSAQDHGSSRVRRAVTLIQAEHVAAIEAILGRHVDALALRRNLLVAGVNLASLRWSTFAVGDVVLRGTMPCEPCEQIEAILGPGGYAAMFGMGGLCAAIVTPGTIRAGDPIRRLGFAEGAPDEEE